MVTSRAGPEERVIGLEHGADDYVIKPFHIKEVVLRVRSLLARYGPLRSPAAEASSERYAFEAGVLDVGRRQLIAPTGQAIPLTDGEFDLLVFLVRNPKRVLTREIGRAHV